MASRETAPTNPAPRETFAQVMARWRKQPSHQDTMPLSHAAQAVVFARSLSADDIAPLVAELEKLRDEWRASASPFASPFVPFQEAYVKCACADALDRLLGKEG